jgi:hypothetical protein
MSDSKGGRGIREHSDQTAGRRTTNDEGPTNGLYSEALYFASVPSRYPLETLP